LVAQMAAQKVVTTATLKVGSMAVMMVEKTVA
jgi:hypothetical protein